MIPFEPLRFKLAHLQRIVLPSAAIGGSIVDVLRGYNHESPRASAMALALNEELLKGNACFGCGPDNPEGLQIRIYRDGARSDRLVGSYRPRETSIGFPQIVHGGLQFTVLDCMAGWTVFVLRNPGKMMPLTKSASTRFHRPVRLGTELALSSELVREAPTPRDPFLIHTEIRDGSGVLLTEVDFEYVILPLDRFMKAAAIEVMPDSYRRHFGEA